MKKIILVASILVGGAISANNTTMKKENDKKEIVSKNTNDKEIVSKSINKKAIKAKAALRSECRTVVVTCTSAYTCQNWSESQWNNWGSQIQSNYCMIDSPFNP